MGEMATDQYIFTLNEFEAESFDASAFLARYRRVATLDSLRAQLRQYSDAIKDQLFVIINRDYRDFITIATKLDGVDTRVEILRRPLLDLRLDLLALHEGLLGSLRSIDAKLHKRSSIRRRKAAVATALQCSALLDSVEEVISSNTSNKSSSSSGGGPSRRQLLLSATPATAEATGVNLDTMRASELERAAHALKRAQSCLLSLEEPIAKEEGASAAAAAQPHKEKEGGLSLPAVRVELIARERSLQEQFCRSARGWLDELLNADTVAAAPAATATAAATVSRPLLHCLRALNAAGRVDVAQQAVDSALMPIVKAQFSQGRVGGAGGRGSFAGLQECLAAILKTLGARFGAVVAAAEVLDAAGAGEGGAEGMDLMVRGVWATVTNTLVERFPEMLSIAIPSTLHSCYTCVSNFTEQLPFVLLGHQEEESKQRILQHPLVQQLHTRWGLDLYFKMRLAEVSGRVDRACDESSYAFVSPAPVPVPVPVPEAVVASSASKTPTNGSTVKGSVVKNSPTANTSSRIHNGFSTSSCLDVYAAAGTDSTLTLTPAQVADVRRSTGIDAAGLRVPLCVLIATEMCTCIHQKVCLPVLTEKLLGLALRLLVRLEAFVVATADVSTAAYPLGARSLSGSVDGAGIALQVHTADAGVSGAGAGVGAGAGLGADVTPTKVALSPPATPRGPGASATFVGPTSDELVLLASDLLNLEKWLMGSFADAAADVVAAAAAANGAVPEPGTGSKASIKHALQGRATALCLLRNKVLCRVQLMLVHECKLALQGGTGAAVAGPVRAIAARFRMTNKAAPEAPSAYVDTVLRPMRNFTKRHPTVLPVLLGGPAGPAGGTVGWARVVLEAVSTCYSVQVQSLTETVRAMDTTLQSRRSKLTQGQGVAAAGAGLTDSDKINLQVKLDVRAYATEVRGMLSGFTPDPAEVDGAEMELPALQQLLGLVEESAVVQAH